jgi:hypothetical protein
MYQRGNQKVPKGSPEGTKEIGRRNHRGDQKVSSGRQKVPIGKPEVIRRYQRGDQKVPKR